MPDRSTGRDAEPSTFELQDWYTSDEVKRNFAKISVAVNEQTSQTTMLGSRAKPLIVITNAEIEPTTTVEISKTIEEIKADWSAVVFAIIAFGTVFRVHGKQHQRVVLRRHQKNRHKAFVYHRGEHSPLAVIADRLDDIAAELRARGVSAGAKIPK